MLLKCSFLALVALVVAVCRAATIDTADQDSIFSKVQETKTVVSITNKVPYMPPMMIIGNDNGSITRCPVAEPNSCELYYSGSTVAVTSTVVHGEYLYASLASGTMLRCLWHKRDSCYEFNKADVEIVGLAVAAGLIHAGLKNGTILRCQLDTPHSCWNWNYAAVRNSLTSLAAFDSFLYAGSYEQVDRCSLTSEQGCSRLNDCGGSDITGMVRLKEKIYALRKGGCSHYFNIEPGQCSEYCIPGSEYSSMALYNQKFYVVRQLEGIFVLTPGLNSTELLASNDKAVSISFAYATFGMQNKYQMESEKCIWKGFYTCPPTVVYYDVHRRAQWEVSVEVGRLYDSQGVLLDTSDSDESHSVKAAIFAMGPDGQLLVSKIHKRGYTHTSSLLAGSPVAGAGLMVVEQGRIRNMTACSVHYRPTLDLNEQVKESLYVKGYTDNIDSYPCSYDGVLCNDLDNIDVNNIS